MLLYIARNIFIFISAPAFSRMKALWLSTLLLFSSCLVTAQNSPGSCNITLDRDVTVPQFCYVSVQGQFPRRLNFTVMNGSLEFEPLPENRQVEIEIDENSDGLEAWANLANAFVDSVRSGSLPYGKVIVVLDITIPLSGGDLVVNMASIFKL